MYYLLATTAELCLSPVGLSAMNRLAPSFLASLIMGAWFYMTAVGNFVAGKIGEATGGESGMVVPRGVGWKSVARLYGGGRRDPQLGDAGALAHAAAAEEERGHQQVRYETLTRALWIAMGLSLTGCAVGYGGPPILRNLNLRLDLMRKAMFVAKEDRLSKNLEKFAAAQEAEVRDSHCGALCMAHAPIQ